MKLTYVALALIPLTGVLTVACGGGNQQDTMKEDMPSMTTPAPSTAPAGESASMQGGVEITFTTEPDPPKMGDNTLEAMVMSGGQPVTDAEVSVEFFMAAMPSMNMPEMRNKVDLKHEGGGRYRGMGNVMMAGAWDATVSVKRGGQEIGSRKLSVTAK